MYASMRSISISRYHILTFLLSFVGVTTYLLACLLDQKTSSDGPMVINVSTEEVSNGEKHIFTYDDGMGTPLKYGDGFTKLIDDSSFRSLIIDIIKADKNGAVFWEFPAANRGNADTLNFEFVLIAAPLLVNVRQTPEDFQAYYTSKCDIVSFYNLGKDAMLVAPCPVKDKNFAHLKSFVNSSSEKQSHSLLINVGVEVQKWFKSTPRNLWVSTSGLGVYWLHVRLDTRPKYYTHSPYKQSSR